MGGRAPDEFAVELKLVFWRSFEQEYAQESCDCERPHVIIAVLGPDV
jgi:hypothetical protein